MVSFDTARYKLLFKQMGYADADGATLLLRTQLLKAVKTELQRKNWTQEQAAEKLGIQRPRISEIYRLKIDKFNVELQVKSQFRLEKEVTVQIENALR